jgi:hypothetical protein
MAEAKILVSMHPNQNVRVTSLEVIIQKEERQEEK